MSTDTRETQRGAPPSEWVLWLRTFAEYLGWGFGCGLGVAIVLVALHLWGGQ